MSTRQLFDRMSSSQRMTSTLTSNVSAAFGQSRFSVRLCVTKCCLGVGIVLGVLGASLLVAFGFLYIKPYTKVKHMRETQCIAVNLTVHSELLNCPCSDDCVAKYPCLQVRVNYTQKVTSQERKEADVEVDDVIVRDVILFDSYETYSRQRATDEQVSVRHFFIAPTSTSCFCHIQ